MRAAEVTAAVEREAIMAGAAAGEKLVVVEKEVV